jgi:hypothetical protein
MVNWRRKDREERREEGKKERMKGRKRRREGIVSIMVCQ